jgi:hypothetical protein
LIGKNQKTMTTECNYVWIFYVEDDSGERINITVMTDTYLNAIAKIKAMGIPYLKTWSNVNDALKLVEIYETETDEEYLGE